MFSLTPPVQDPELRALGDSVGDPAANPFAPEVVVRGTKRPEPLAPPPRYT